MTNLSDLKEKWLTDPTVREAYNAIAPEFEIARAMIKARTDAGLTQEEVAKRMGTTRSAVARLESGRTMPSIKTLYRYADATGSKPEIRLVHQP